MNEGFFDYSLPSELIAQSPLKDRAASRLLVLDRSSGQIQDRIFREVPTLLQKGDTLVLNDTRVTARRLTCFKTTGGKVELVLLGRIGPQTYRALAKPARTLRPGTDLHQPDADIEFTVTANLGEGIVELEVPNKKNLRSKLESVGSIPLPPYIHTALHDSERYQTVYAKSPGSAAAPTAGLHFTQSLLNQIAQAGIAIARITLDVGLDTFRPVQSDPADHKMHGEQCTVSQQAADTINQTKARVIAVGTTAVRTLESMAIGPKRVHAGSKSTTLFIRPGFRFQVVDAMFTNFHMPRTTMLLMIAAFASPDLIEAAYSHAVCARYRFLSFGDSMLLL